MHVHAHLCTQAHMWADHCATSPRTYMHLGLHAKVAKGTTKRVVGTLLGEALWKPSCHKFHLTAAAPNHTTQLPDLSAGAANSNNLLST